MRVPALAVVVPRRGFNRALRKMEAVPNQERRRADVPALTPSSPASALRSRPPGPSVHGVVGYRLDSNGLYAGCVKSAVVSQAWKACTLFFVGSPRSRSIAIEVSPSAIP